MATVTIICDECGNPCEKTTGHVNRSRKIGAKLFCDRKCAGIHRQNSINDEQKKVEKAEYDRQYRLKNKEKLKDKKAKYYQENRDPEKEREKRKMNMHKHVDYCRKPEYKKKKQEYDKRKRLEEYGYFSECKALLMELENEIRKRATRYEIYIANGRFTRSAIQRRRAIWQQKKTSNQILTLQI